MRIMPLIATVSLCVASAAASGTNVPFSHKAASETRTELCESEVRELASVFRLRLQVLQPDLLDMMTLDRPADQLRRIRAVYALDFRGSGQETMRKADSLLNLHYSLCLHGIDK